MEEPVGGADVTAIKICGITREEEIEYLNEAGVDYAGFVFYEKSKRYLSVAEAEKVSGKLNQNIKKVAVTVKPEAELIRQIEQAGFDILQIHGMNQADFERTQMLTALPVWLAANLTEPKEVRRWRDTMYMGESGILFDAGVYGSGRTFGWETKEDASGEAWREAVVKFRQQAAEAKLTFLLAGGLDAANVAEGIKIFAPDVVDVSSGVEETLDGVTKKSKEKIEAFVRAVRTQDAVEKI